MMTREIQFGINGLEWSFSRVFQRTTIALNPSGPLHDTSDLWIYRPLSHPVDQPQAYHFNLS